MNHFLTYQLEHGDWLWIAWYFSEVSQLMSLSATRESYIPRGIFKKCHKIDHVTGGICMTIYPGQLNQPITRHGGVA